MLLVFIAMLSVLSEIIVVMILILIGLIFLALHFSIRGYSGNNLYTTLLLSFLIPGLGIAYIGRPLMGLAWYIIQFISVFVAHLVSQSADIEEKYLGLIIILPFFVQLYITGFEFKKRYGDVDW